MNLVEIILSLVDIYVLSPVNIIKYWRKYLPVLKKLVSWEGSSWYMKWNTRFR